MGERVRTRLKSDQRDIETGWGSDRQITREELILQVGLATTTGITLLSVNTFYLLNMPI